MFSSLSHIAGSRNYVFNSFNFYFINFWQINQKSTSKRQIVNKGENYLNYDFRKFIGKKRLR